jgi:RNA polymerase sigma factor (sigma-70 family)
MKRRSDAYLVRHAKSGDREAGEAIFRRYHQELYRYSVGIVRSPEDAQDALQNTMVKALRALSSERREIDLKPWLYRIAHNESIEILRRRRPSEELDPETAAAGAGPAEQADARERLRGLLADLGELPERQRGALVMRELSDLDFEQIGAMAPERPYTRAMPSPAVSTVPVSVTETFLS